MTQDMKVLMVTRESKPEKHIGSDKRYGLNKSLAPLIDELTRRGIQVDYLSQSQAGEVGIVKLRRFHRFINKLLARFFSDTEFTAISWGILERLNMGRLAVKVMAKGNYTHVHCHDPFIAAGFRWIARIRWYACLRRCHTARWGVTEHGFGCFSQAFHDDGARLGTSVMKWLKAWESRVLLKAHWVISPTQLGLQQLARDLSIYPIPDNWYAIPHPKPYLNKYPKIEARRRLRWEHDTIYIIAAGRFAELKRFPDLVKACAKIQHSNWQLYIIGEGDRVAIKQLAKNCGIGNRVGFAISDDIGLYYSAADIYVSTSLTESFGLANFEALHMGLPSICTAVGGVPEVQGSGARLIPAENKIALVNALQDFLDYPEIRDYWSRQALAWVASWPKLTQIANMVQNCYQGQKAQIQKQQLSIYSHQSILECYRLQIENMQLCPLPKVLKLPRQGTKILVFAPHNDDETFACGGTLALLNQQGCSVKVVVLTDGGKNSELLEPDEITVTRRKETDNALAILGIKDKVYLSEPDGNYQGNERVRETLAAVIQDYQPDWIFIPSIADNHRDHVAVSLTLIQLWSDSQYKETIYMYETWAPVMATAIVDISSVMELKRKAMECYLYPQNFCDYWTAFSGLASYRGVYLQKKGGYAEAFVEVRKDFWKTDISNLLTIRKNIEHF